MKSWFAISLALNLILLGLVCSGSRQATTFNSAVVKEPAVPVRENRHKPEGAAPGIAAVTRARDGDWHSWLDELRTAGVPNKVLAELGQADFENRWEEQQRVLQRKYENGEVAAAALAQADAEHNAEREKELRIALGEEGFRQWDKENTLREMNTAGLGLSSFQNDALYQLRKNLFQQRHDLEQASQKGDIDEVELNQKLSVAQSQYEQQAKTLLGEENYAAMTRAPDTMSATLQRQLKDLNANGEQVAALLQAQQQWNQQHALLDRQSEGGVDNERQKRAIDAARDNAFQQVLGANGFAEYTKSQDTSFQTMKHYAAAWQLNEADIDYLYNAVHEYNQSVEKYRAQAKSLEAQGQVVDWDGVQNNLRQFSTQTAQTFGEYLGDQRFAKMKQNNVFEFSAPQKLSGASGNSN